MRKIAREQLQTLTEPMYYILLALLKECCGVDVMKRVEEISGKRIKIGPGTLYALLQRFEQSNFIEQTRIEGRIKWYIISPKGKNLLNNEYKRLKKMCFDRDLLMGEINNER